jgi:hypothetical protein
MSYYTPRDGDWTRRSDPPADAPYIEVDETAPTVRFVGGPESSVELSGAPARSDAETVHTLMIVASDLTDGTTLCALRAEDNDLTVEDRRPPDARTRFADAFEQLQAAMDEILIPVYIDDAIEELSETVDGLVALHTAQYADPPQASCSYFRTSVFEDGTLLLEAERGSL